MKKIHLLATLIMMVNIATAQTKPVGIFTNHEDVGHPKMKGTTSFDAASQTYTMKGAGYNIWFARDEFQYAYKKLTGDFILTANFEFVGRGINPHRKIGWMVRTSTDAQSAHISAVVHGEGLTVLQWRGEPGAAMRDPEDEIVFAKKKPQVIQLERKGKNMIMRAGAAGEALQVVGEHAMPNMTGSVLAGLFICSHDSTVVEQAKVWNVRIDQAKVK